MNIESPIKGDAVSFELGEDYPELRDAVRRICAKYPGAYWRDLEDRSAYPTEFVADLTDGRISRGADPAGVRRRGPADPRRGRDPRRDQHRGLHGDAVPRADVHHGHAAAARQRRAEAALSAGHRARRVAPAGLRRDRADHRLRHHQAEDPRREEGQRPLRGQRPEGVDLARAALRPDAAARAHHAGRGGEEAIRRPVGVPGRHPRVARQGHGHPPAQGDGQPQHHGSVLRQSRSAGREPDRRGRQGPLATSWTA